MGVIITEKAAKEIQRVMQEQNLKAGEDVIRIAAVGGGCSGFSYGLTFAKKTEFDALNDVLYEGNGIEWVVDNRSAPFLEGTTVDFHDALDKRGFAFNNPQATRSCGCGQSFSTN